MAKEAKKRLVVKKKVANAVLYETGEIKIEGVRLSYPHLDRPYKGGNDDGGKPAFSLSGIMPKNTHRAAKDLIKSVMDGMLAEKKIKALPSDRKFLKDGDLSGKEEYENSFVFNCREETPPKLRDESGDAVDREDARGKFYAGCVANVLIRPWLQDNKYGKRINANLLAVQFVKDGEPIGEGRISDDDIDDVFDPVDDEDSGYDADEDDDGI